LIKGTSGIISFIGVGANQGRPAAQCLEAIEHMRAAPGIHVLRRSSLYRTEPVGLQEQDWFVNAVVEIRTLLLAGDLLQALQAVERRMGREGDVRWGPRVIDLDILLYGQQVIQSPGMDIPHPEFHKRRFVLVPFHEIAPYAVHPSFGVSIHGLLERLEDKLQVELIQ
jgi:2-amino-4-hydroxy-6-hydroxymethyldihydropteridine diphosphokinase